MRGIPLAGWARRCVLVMAIFAGVVPVRGADEDSSQAYLPPDTYLYVSCPSVVDMKARFAETAMGQLWADRSMSAFREELAGKFDEASAEVEREIGLPLSKLLELPAGDVTLAGSKVNNRLGFALMMDVGDNTATLKTLMEKLDEELASKGTKTTETYQDVEMTVLKQGNEKGGVLVHFVDESDVVFATSVDLAKAILDRWDGKHESTFANNANMKTIVEECEESDDKFSDIYVYVDPVNLVLEAMKMTPQTAGNAAMAQGFLPILGVDKLKAFGMVVSLESKEFDSVSRSMLIVDQPVAGVLGIFKMPAVIEGPPSWVGKDVDQYSGLSWDVPGAYASINGLMQMFAPQTGGLDAILDQAAGHPANPGIHPKKDILDQLTGLMHVIAKSDAASAEDVQKIMFAIGVKDELTVQNVFEKLAAQAPNLKPRQFEGVTIYDIEAGGATTPAIAVTRGHLLIATHPSPLEATIRGKASAEEPLSQSEDYKAVAKHLETPASMLSFARPATQMRSLWMQARSGKFNEQLQGLDLTKLPEFEAVEKYFAPGGSYTVPHEKGAFMMQFSLPAE